MKADEYDVARSWDSFSRFAVLGLLVLSSLQFLSVAILLGSIGENETHKLVSAACMVLAGISAAVAFSFRKSGAPTWKHKLIVAFLALPAALSMISN